MPDSPPVPKVRLLVVRGLEISLGDQRVTPRLDLEIDRGQAMLLQGGNGCGKTSLLNVVSGLRSPHRGSIRLAGLDVTRLPLHRLARMGVARLFQEPRCFASLSVADHLALAAPGREQEGLDLLQRLAGESTAPAARAPSLSHGQRRLLNVAMVLVRKPALALLDEPFAGLARVAAGRVASEIRRAAGGGTAVLLTSHRGDAPDGLMGPLVRSVDLDSGGPYFR